MGTDFTEVFEFLFKEFTNTFKNNNKTYKGYKLIVCDGSDLCIAHNPNDKTTYFQSQPADRGFNQLHLNAFYDLLRRIYTDAVVQSGREENEKRAMCNMIDRYEGNTNTVFIADRNYENHNIFAHAEKRGMYYLIRVKDIDSTGILGGLKLPKTEPFDKNISLTLTTKQTKEIKADREKYKFIPSTSTFDCLNRDNKFYDISFRAVRFPSTEDSYECIITNLPENEFDSTEIRKLYQMRWGIETSFRELKYAMGITQFHAKKTDYIKQEIWTKLLLYNFVK